MLEKKSTIKVLIPSNPYSTDPAEFDAYVHHICFGSAFLTLTSNSRKFGLEGRLTQQWESSQNYTTWKFSLRPNLYDSNGVIIDGQYILSSLKRFFFMQRKKGSKSFVSSIKGIENLQSIKENIEGLSLCFENNLEVLTFSLNNPVIDLDHQLAFGIYGIASPENYHSQNGDWTTEKKLVSTGPYRVHHFSSDRVELHKRDHFTLYDIDDSPSIVIVKKDAVENYEEYDFFRIPDYESNIINLHNYNYYVHNDYSIRFMRINSYFKNDSLFKHPHFRHAFINFLKEHYLIKLGIPEGFFPSLHSQRSLTTTANIENDLAPLISSHLKNYPMQKIRIMKTTPPKSSHDSALMDGIIDFFGHNKIPHEFVENDIKILISSLDQDWQKDNVDIATISTSILNNNPYSDIDFMFNSSEGIRLPDPRKQYPTIKERGKSNKSILEMNQFLNEDAIVLPLIHFQRRFFYKTHLDLSDINAASSFSDFSTIKIKVYPLFK
jgi:hypothetical protein